MRTSLPSFETYHIATHQQPTPPNHAAPITWLIAANGIFKHGRNHDLSIRIQVDARSIPIPGLIGLLPEVRWATMTTPRLPGKLLGAVLDDARHAATTTGQLIEKQYFYVNRDGIRVVAPCHQTGTATSLAYTMVDGQILCDLHSHHHMAAYFSTTDDHDDSGLSVSVVIGKITTAQPEIITRLNVWGHRQRVPAITIFDTLGPFHEVGGSHADPHD